MKTVMVISDSTGDTGERMVRAASRQFEAGVTLRTYPNVRQEAEIEELVVRAAESKALIVFTVVHEKARDALARLVAEHNVQAIDLMGALMGSLTRFLGAEPSNVPGLLHTLSEDYFKRMEAVDFAVKNDDGAEPRNLPKADLVLVGISRTSKTPLSTYLAQRGLKVANVPLVLGIDPPAELSEVADSRVYGLIIRPEALMQIRQARLQHLGMPKDSSYATRNHIEQEIEFSRGVFRNHPSWPVIDVTNRAIEETAADILRLHRNRVGTEAKQ